jgi:EAL domain-containing protein (putative c-di-GMP-specific phosphodiesterase class I)/GGDEF domain-containing protein
MIHFGRFHQINKTLGHIKADELFKKVVLELNNAITHLEGVYNLSKEQGQNHFIAIVEGVSVALLLDQQELEKQQVNIETISSMIIKPENFQGLQIDLGAKLGITHYPNQAKDISLMLRQTLIAIDVGIQKSQLVTYYVDEINPYSEKLLSLAGDLRKAVEQNTLELFYHPQIDIKNQKVIGVEALLRWNHPEYGYIPPDEFIPLAEQTGAINDVTRWVLNLAISHAVKLQNLGYEMMMSVNISAINLKQVDFINQIEDLLQKHQLSPQKLILEVTETAMMDDPVNALEVLTALNEKGIKISIDDFGTGYSSLAYIKQLPVKEVKIDRSFVANLDTDHENVVIVNTTINMSHDLNLKVVAEGIETEDVQKMLHQLGCDFAQGFLFTKPIPFNDLKNWLTTR